MNLYFTVIFSVLLCVIKNGPIDRNGRPIAGDTSNRTEKSANIVSGVYQNTSLAYDSGKKIFSGVYEYYGNWDNHFKEYLNINVFFFYGIVNSNTEVEIKSGWPGDDELINGKINFLNTDDSNHIRIFLVNQPLGYSNVDFTKFPGVILNKTIPKNWIEIRIVKSNKARIFNLPDSSTIRKGYLVKNDIVKIIARNSNGWLNIEYNAKNENTKSVILWIREEDLYNIDPTKW